MLSNISPILIHTYIHTWHPSYLPSAMYVVVEPGVPPAAEGRFRFLRRPRLSQLSCPERIEPWHDIDVCIYVCMILRMLMNRCVSIYVCMYECIYRMYVITSLACIYVCMYACMLVRYVCMHVCVVCMYECLYVNSVIWYVYTINTSKNELIHTIYSSVCMYVLYVMYVCMYLYMCSMYACMYVCMYVMVYQALCGVEGGFFVVFGGRVVLEDGHQVLHHHQSHA